MTPEVYPYEPISSGDVCRYIVLQPGVDEEELECTVHTAIIADSHFEALSYVWGDPTRNHTIRCDAYVITITSSLSKVLKRIRRPNQPLSLWADGICINQENLTEKGHQVSLMAKIYRAAQRVLIFVGSEDEGQGPAVSSLLDETDKMIAETSKAVDMSWDSFPYPVEDDALLSDPRWNALHSLLAQNWFDRGWVVQEAALASRGEVLWGESRFDWEKLMRVHVWLATRAPSTYNSFLFSEVLINAHTNIYLDTHQEFGQAFYDDEAWGSPSLLQTLNNAKELDLSDPRDRIYAFLELPQHRSQNIWVKPNYYTTYLDTYRQFAIQYVSATNTVELLDYVSHDETSPFSIPSWIPRWDISTWSLGRSSAASSVCQSRTGSISKPVLMEDGSLKVQGVNIDKLHYVSDVFDWDTTTARIIKKIWDHISVAAVPCPYVALHETDYRPLEAFFSALGNLKHNGEYTKWLEAQEEFALRAQLKPPQANPLFSSAATASGPESESNTFFESIRNSTHNKRFILTERGYMGLAPGIVRKSDYIGIIFGCKTPCLLRSTDTEQYYTYVGATALVGKDYYDVEGGRVSFCDMLGEDDSREWVEWDVEEEDMYLC